jgi:ParB family transcriptional regulator, chromosome partitioning protein
MGTPKKRLPRLGRGLNSLMSAPVQVQPIETAPPAPPPPTAGLRLGQGTVGTAPQKAPPSHSSIQKPPLSVTEQAGLTYIPLTSLEPNRHQPRQRFDETSLKRLSESIKSEGIMQPIVARRVEAGSYEIVAGERRWRAAELAGLSVIPAIVRDLTDQQLAEWALIENIQREDLNPIERAEAFSRLIDQFGLSHEEAGARVGMDRSTISNHLRLLNLAQTVQQLVLEGLVSMGQARALAGLSDTTQQEVLARRAVQQGMSVREVESAVRRLTASPTTPGQTSRPARSAYLAGLEKQIAEQLGTKVAIKPSRKKGAGTLCIDFYSLDEFDALASRMGVHIE